MSLISGNLLSRSSTEIGKIKIGGKGEERTKRGGGKYRMPVKYDHFVITGLDRGDDGNFVRDDAAHQRLGEKPTEIPAVLMFQRPEDNFHSEMQVYAGRKKIVSCDGEIRHDLQSGEEMGCERARTGECSCKPYSRLALQLPFDPAFGFRVFRSTSWETVRNIQSTLLEIFERVGTCYQVPVELRIYPSEDTYFEDGKEKTTTSYKVALVLGVSMEEALNRVVQADRALKGTRQQLRLSAGELAEELQATDDAAGAPDEGLVVDAEFEIEGEDEDDAPAEDDPRVAELAEEYRGILEELEMSPEAVTGFQTKVIGKADAESWEVADFEKAIEYIKARQAAAAAAANDGSGPKSQEDLPF